MNEVDIYKKIYQTTLNNLIQKEELQKYENMFFEKSKISQTNKALMKKYFEIEHFKPFFLTIWKDIKEAKDMVDVLNTVIPELEEGGNYYKFLKICQIKTYDSLFSENYFC